MKNLLDELNDEQREAVIHTEGPLLIFAGAGTGKTRVITYRIAYLISKCVNPKNILAMTFTNKAADEMKRRIDGLVGTDSDVWVSTFHSFCAKFLRIEINRLGIDRNFIIFDENDSKQLIKNCIRELNLDDEKYRPSILHNIISRAKDDLIDCYSYEINVLAEGDEFKVVCAQVYKEYQKGLSKYNGLDFGDLQIQTVRILKEKKDVFEKYTDRFKYVLIDEYQDINQAQYILTKLLSSKHKNICVVGDDDQSIYSWRGSNIRYILDFEDDFKDAKIVKLEKNYRSTENILNSAWNVIKNNTLRSDKKLWTEKKEGESVSVLKFYSDLNEADGVVSIIEGLLNEGRSPSDIAIFYRTNAQSRIFENALRLKSIPHRIIGTMRFYSRAEVKDILAYLRVVINQDEEVSLRRIINTPTRGIGERTIEDIENYAKEEEISFYQVLLENPMQKKKISDFVNLIESIKAVRESLSAKEIVKLVIEKTGYLESLEIEDTIESKNKIQNIKELVSAVAEYEELSDDKTLDGFLEKVSLSQVADELKNVNEYITLMTLHLAKGLEFSVVFITGMEEGLFPIREATLTLEELEEERRLCYVGMTRAKEKLYLSYAEHRRLYDTIINPKPSRFIKETGLFSPIGLRRDLELSEDIITRGVSRLSLRPKGVPVGRATDSTILLGTNSDKFGEFSIGTKVKHKSFGEGEIVERTGGGEEVKVVVMFETGEWKKLHLKWANLEVLG